MVRFLLHLGASFVLMGIATLTLMELRALTSATEVTFYVIYPTGYAFLLGWAGIFLLIHRSEP